MYIRRKVFSTLVDEETGEERLFSTTEFINEDNYPEQREFASVRKLAKNAQYLMNSAGMSNKKKILGELVNANRLASQLGGKLPSDKVLGRIAGKGLKAVKKSGLATREEIASLSKADIGMAKKAGINQAKSNITALKEASGKIPAWKNRAKNDLGL